MSRHLRECEDCKQVRRVFVVTLVPESFVDFGGPLGITYTKHWLCTSCIAVRERARLRKYAVEHVNPWWGKMMDESPWAAFAFAAVYGGPEPLHVSD